MTSTISLYQRQVSFAQENQEFPGEPLNGGKIDVELDAIGLRLNQLIMRLNLLVRPDGKLKNATVDVSSFTQEALDFITAFGGSGVQVPEEQEGGGVGGPIPGEGSGGSSIVFFRQLLDTPNSFLNAQGKPLVVNMTATGITFGDFPTPVVSFSNLTDADSLSSAVANRYFRANSVGDRATWVELNVEPGAHYARLDDDNDFDFNRQNKQDLGAYREKLVDLGEIAGTVQIDPSSGNHFRGDVVGPCAFVFSTTPTVSGSCYSLTLSLSSPSGTFSHTYFSSHVFDWGPNGVPLLEEGTRNAFTFLVFPTGICLASSMH